MPETYLNLAGLTQYDKKIKEVIQKDLADEFDESGYYVLNDYVVKNGLLYRCINDQETVHGSWDDSDWQQVKVSDFIGITNVTGTSPISVTVTDKVANVSLAYSSQAAKYVLAAPNDQAGVPSFRQLVASDISGVVALASIDAKGDLLVGTADNTIGRLAVDTDGYVLKADSSTDTGLAWGTLSSSDVGLGNVANTGDSATPTQNGTTKFTTGGAYTLKADLMTEIKRQASHYRGSFDTWAAVPTTNSTSVDPHYIPSEDDASGTATPTNNDYMIVQNASGYGSQYTGTWRFYFAGVWNNAQGTASKEKWTPAYKIDSPQSFRTINGNSIIGTGDIVTPYPIRQYDSGLQISTASTGTDCALYVPNAASDQAGVVTTAAQTLAGVKTFSSAPLFTSGASYKQGANSSYATLVGNGSASTATTITLPAASGTLVISTDLPQVTFSTTTLTGATTIKGLTIGTDKYNFYVPSSINAATSSVLGSVKLFNDTSVTASINTVSTTSGRYYGIQFNSNQQMVVNVPWTDTASAANNILAGSNNGTTITYAPYTSKGAGHFYTATDNPNSTANSLKYDGKFYATELYDGGNRVLTSASTYVSDVQINSDSIVSSKEANIKLVATQAADSIDSTKITTTIGYGSGSTTTASVQLISITNTQINNLFS